MYANFIEYVVKSMVDHPEDVTVSEQQDSNAVLVDVRVNEQDMGRVIGKNGRVVNALRTLVQILGTKHDARVSLEIHT
jgi:hypothetical protein